MGKNKSFYELINLIVVALRHKIGSIVNPNEVYANKYAKDAETLMNEARKSARQENWNNYEIQEIGKEVRKKLRKELEEKTFLDNKKFDIMNREIEKVLKELGLL